MAVSVANLITLLQHPSPQPCRGGMHFFSPFFVFPPCLFPVAISVFNLTPAGGKKGLLFPLKDSVARRHRRQKWEEGELSTQAGRDGGNLGLASLSTKAFHLSPPQDSGILLSTYLIRKLSFLLPIRESKKEKYRSPTQKHKKPLIALSGRYRPFYPR